MLSARRLLSNPAAQHPLHLPMTGRSLFPTLDPFQTDFASPTLAGLNPPHTQVAAASASLWEKSDPALFGVPSAESRSALPDPYMALAVPDEGFSHARAVQRPGSTASCRRAVAGCRGLAPSEFDHTGQTNSSAQTLPAAGRSRAGDQGLPGSACNSTHPGPWLWGLPPPVQPLMCIPATSPCQSSWGARKLLLPDPYVLDAPLGRAWLPCSTLHSQPAITVCA